MLLEAYSYGSYQRLPQDDDYRLQRVYQREENISSISVAVTAIS